MEIIHVALPPRGAWAITTANESDRRPGQHLLGIREIQAMPGEVAAILRFVPFAGSGQPYARNPFEVPAVSGQQRAAVGGHDAGNQAVGHPDGTT